MGGNAVDQTSAATAVGNSLGNHSLHSEVRLFGQYRRHENLFCRARQVVLRKFYAHGKWRDSLPRRPPIQVIPSPSSLKNLSWGTRSGMLIYIRMREPGRFQTTLDWIRRLDHTGGATLPVAHEKRPCCATRTARMKWSAFAVASMYWSIFDFASCARTKLTADRATAMEI